jgi:hypothetical protein
MAQNRQKGPNGLPITRAARLDRESGQAKSSVQNRPDLGAAQRRRVHGRVGPRRRGSRMLSARTRAVGSSHRQLRCWQGSVLIKNDLHARRPREWPHVELLPMVWAL